MTKTTKVALVTGANGGIGSAVAKRLAADGFSIALHYSSDIEKAKKVQAEVSKADVKTVLVKGDISKFDDVKTLFDESIRGLGKIDVVVHTAGIMPLSEIKEGKEEDFDKVIAVNLKGTYALLSQAAQHVDEEGRIIAFSSSVVGMSFPKYGAYIASKAGVEGLVHVLANEMRGRNITVNAVAPGPTATPLFLNGKTDEEINKLKKANPLERLGEPEDIARVVSFLSGPDGAWVNGQIIRANGGMV